MSEKRRIPLLIEEHPILVYPTLARAIGINKAVIMQQVHFLLNSARVTNNQYNQIDDKWWVYNSYHEWLEYFPWLSIGGLKRMFIELEKDGFITSRQSVKNKSDRRKWYTINYEAWLHFVTTIGAKCDDGSMAQNDTVVVVECDDGYSETPSETKTTSVPKRARKKPSKTEVFWLEWQQHENAAVALLNTFGYDTAFKEPRRYPLRFLDPYLEAAKQLDGENAAEFPAALRYVRGKAKRERWSAEPTPLTLVRYFPEYQRSKQPKILTLTPDEEFPLPTANPDELRARLSGDALLKASGDYE